MSSEGSVEFDTKEIARATFPNAFRGYDQEAVRHYLVKLAAAIRQAQNQGSLGVVAGDDGSTVRLMQLEQENDLLQSEIGELREMLANVPADRQPITTELTEGQLIDMLGSETAQIVASARSAASEITKRAESEAEATTLESEAKANALVQDAEATLASARAKADDLAKRATTAARELEVHVVSEVEQTRQSALDDAERTRLDADEAAERIRTETALQVDNDLAVARQKAARVIGDAEAKRDEILGDLVRRRRAGQSQLDRLADARVQLVDSLQSAGRNLESVVSGLHVSNSDPVDVDLRDVEPAGGDAAEVSDLVDELMAAQTQPVTLASAATPIPAATSRSRTTNGANAAEGHGKPATVATKPNDFTELDDDARRELANAFHYLDAPGSEADLSQLTADIDPYSPVDVGRLLGFDQPSLSTRNGAANGSGPRSGSSHLGDDYAGNSNGTGGPGYVDHEAPLGTHLLGVETFEDYVAEDSEDDTVNAAEVTRPPVAVDELSVFARQVTRGDLPRSVAYNGRLPSVFEGRDTAMARIVPGFKRVLKRAVNDDQSDVLDRLRGGRGSIQPEELPNSDLQLGRYIEALRAALYDMVAAGASYLDHDSVSEQSVQNLSVQLGRHIVDSLRRPISDIIEGAPNGDREAILDPIRSIYRDFRNSVLNDLIEDALHEAYALGLYGVIDEGERVIWLPDPRLDADPICEENSASKPLVKGAGFPSGHPRPLSMPGCRCLVVPG